jgi:hypothetical protein
MWWHFSDSFLRIAAQKETAEVSKWHKALFRAARIGHIAAFVTFFFGLISAAYFIGGVSFFQQ